MAVDVELLTSSSLNNIGTNFQRVQTALQDAVSRSGNLPNSMNADLDIDSNDILNAANIYANAIFIDGVEIGDLEWIIGNIPPTIDMGDKGDLYLDTITGNLYGPKSDLGWGPVVGNIKGPQGEQGVPGIQGEQGLQGESFDPDAVGLTADRATYDGQPKNFSFLDTQLGLLYFKLSNTSGDWSAGIAFATGPQGPTGAAGVGVPAGGTTGQILSKVNGTDYNTQWVTTGISDGDKGDIVVSSSGTVWNIDNNALIESKLNVSLANRLTYVATTKAEMRAVDTTRYQVIILRHASLPMCDGVFVWRTGDYAALVAIDVWEGVFLKATAISASVGCWVRVDARHDRGSGTFQSALNVAWFGAFGNSYGDSVGSFTSADSQIQSAIDLLPAGVGGAIYIPSGYYYMNATLVWANKPVRIYGDGKDQTQLLMNGTNVSGIYITHTGSLGRLSRQYSVQLEDFSIVRKTGNGGVGVRVKWPESTDNTARFMARNFAIYSENDGTGYFSTGIELVNCSGSRIENVSVKGDVNSNSNWATDNPWGMAYGILLQTDGGNTTGHINHFWSGLTIGETDVCIRVEGWYEGFYMTNFEFVHCRTGISVDGYSVTKNPVFYVANGHIECRTEIAYLTNVNGPSFFNIVGYCYRNMASASRALWTFNNCERIKLIGAGAQDAGINNTGLKGYSFVSCNGIIMQGCSAEDVPAGCVELSSVVNATFGGLFNRDSTYHWVFSGTNGNVKISNDGIGDNVTNVSSGSTSGITFL